MTEYKVYANVIVTKMIGIVEAESEDEAVNKVSDTSLDADDFGDYEYFGIEGFVADVADEN